MIMLVAGGDSIIWGSELEDSPHGGPNGYSKKTFAAHLAGKHYMCVAYPGIGNQEIARRIKEVLSWIPPTGVLVCWTWPTRDNQIDADEYILDMQEYLEYHKISYLFTCVDNCVVTQNPNIHWENWYLFPPSTNKHDTCVPRGFYQWAVENKYSIGVDGHPLEQAHRDAAKLIKEKFNELVKKSI